MQQKIRSYVKFDLTNFDLVPWVTDGAYAAHDGGGSGGAGGSREDMYIYDLYSVVNHQGGLSSGHYTTFGLNTAAQECGQSSRGAWWALLLLLSLCVGALCARGMVH